LQHAHHHQAGNQERGVWHRAIHLHPAFEHMRENQQIQQRGQDRCGYGLESHLPEARKLFAQQGGKARAHVVARFDDGCAAHAVTPRYSSSWCMMRTKASSRWLPPTRASSAWVVSSAIMRPFLTMAMRPHSASASSR